MRLESAAVEGGDDIIEADISQVVEGVIGNGKFIPRAAGISEGYPSVICDLISKWEI